MEGIECVAVNIFIKNVELLCLSYYNPPQCQLNVQKLTEIQKNYKNIIICGDLNAKNVNLGCKNNNSNGTLLEDLLLNTNLLVVNNADHTLLQKISDLDVFFKLLFLSRNSYHICKALLGKRVLIKEY